MQDPYTVLGVNKSTGQADLKKTYRKLAMKLHPDQNPGDDKIAEKFKEVSAAYALLSDEKMKARYDRGEINPDGSEKGFSGYRQSSARGANPFGNMGGNSSHSGFGAGFDAEDLFSNLFGGARAQTQRPKVKKRGEDKIYKIRIDFLDAIHGSKETIKLENGKTLSINTPNNVKEGQQIRLKGQGRPSMSGGPNGDALIEINIRQHPYFTMKDNNIHMDLPITLEEAVLGGKVTVPTIFGKIALTIPKNSNSGKKMRLKDKGIKDIKNKKVGDQVVKLMIMIPEKLHSVLKKNIKKWSSKDKEEEIISVRGHLQ